MCCTIASEVADGARLYITYSIYNVVRNSTLIYSNTLALNHITFLLYLACMLQSSMRSALHAVMYVSFHHLLQIAQV